MEKQIIEEFIKSSGKNFTAYSFKFEEKEEKVRVFNNWGYEIKPEVAICLIEGMINAYFNINEEEKFKIIKQNADNEFENEVYYDGPHASKSEFRKNLKRDWGFTCENCGKKISSKHDKYWWRISGPNYQFNEKYCSEECIQPDVDRIRNNIRSRIYQRFGVK